MMPQDTLEYGKPTQGLKTCFLENPAAGYYWSTAKHVRNARNGMHRQSTETAQKWIDSGDTQVRTGRHRSSWSTETTSRGNSHILTFMEYLTKWPEAIPLPNTKSETVARALTTIFCRFGFPEYLLSDRGTNLTSELMQRVCELLALNDS